MLALVSSPVAQRRLQDAFEGRVRIIFAGTVADARLALREVRGIRTVIAEPVDRDGRVTAGWIRAVLQRHPSLSIVGYCRPGIHTGQDIFAFANAGAHDLLVQGADDSGSGLARVLKTASRAAGATQIEAALTGMLPGKAMAIVSYCLRYPHIARTVQAVADALGYNRKTLSKYCAGRNLPSPEALVSWSRLFLAAEASSLEASTVEAAALDLGFEAAAGLRNLLRRHAKLSPQELRAVGVSGLAEKFREVIHSAGQSR